MCGVVSALQFDATSLTDHFMSLLGNSEFDKDHLFDYFSDLEAKPVMTSSSSSCQKSDLEKLNEKSFGATLNCPGNSGASVDHKNECYWSCDGTKFVKLPRSKENAVQCLDGTWKGIKRAVCVGKCTWRDLRRLQTNGEYSHCQNQKNMGEGRFVCKVETGDLERGIKKTKRARCSCANSRQSGHCSWIQKGMD